MGRVPPESLAEGSHPVLQSRRAHFRVLAPLLFLLAWCPLGPSSAGAQRWAGPIPSSVTAEKGVLYLGGNRFTAPMTLTFAGSQFAVNGMMLPTATTTEASPETVPTSPEFTRMSVVRVYVMLLAFKRHLEEGGLIICLPRQEILIPIEYAPLFDEALPKLLTGQELSTTEERQLRTRIPRARWEEASHPLPLVDTELDRAVIDYVTSNFEHGMSSITARQFGVRALPTLAHLLRDDSMRASWHNVAAAIGCIGDTSYFDTLRTFIWDRFHGTLDMGTFQGVGQAQASLGPMAALSPRALDYLKRTVDPQVWVERGSAYVGVSPGYVAEYMANMTLWSLAWAGSKRAEAILDSVVPRDARQAALIQEAKGTNERVRSFGLEAAWRATENRHWSSGPQRAETVGARTPLPPRHN